MSDNPLAEWRLVFYAPESSEVAQTLWQRLGIEAAIHPDRRVGTRRLSRFRSVTAPERRLTSERRGRYPYQFSGALVRPGD